MAVTKNAPDPARRTAAIVATVSTMMESGRAEEAIDLLDFGLDSDDAEPVDHAWLSVQKARACAEIGRLDEARDLAARAQAIGVIHADDVTATAVSGAAAIVLFETSTWGQGDVVSFIGGAIAGADTAAAWWRTQTTTRALIALTERTFRTWSHDTSIRFGAGDVANDELLSASLIAGFNGDQSSWRRLSGLLGQDGLIRLHRDCDPQDAADALRELRLSGSDDAIKLAARRLADDGPADAVSIAANEIDLEISTRTTAPSDLALLKVGGDLLEIETADLAARWLLRTVGSPQHFAARTTPAYLVVPRLLETLAGVVPSTSPDVQRLVVEHVIALPPQADQLLTMLWADVIQAVSDDMWDATSSSAVGAVADGHESSLRLALLGIASRFDAEIRQRLLEEAAAGSLDALAVLGDVTQLPEDAVRALVQTLSASVQAQIDAAQRSAFGMGGHDFGRALSILNIWHPDLAEWQPVIDLIGNVLVAGEHKRGATFVLANNVDRIPASERDRLLPAAREASGQADTVFAGLRGEQTGVSGSAIELVSALRRTAGQETDDTEDADTFASLLAGNEQMRASAADIAAARRRPEDSGVLIALVNDDDIVVRTAAALGLARLVADGEGGIAALAAARRAAADPGRRVPKVVALALSQGKDLSDEAADLLNRLRQHRSSSVRRAAAIRIP
jgi:hypothetical protein